MGTRLSYWPLVASLAAIGFASLPRGGTWRLLGGLGSGALLWAVPFFKVVGVRSFVELGITHLRGHFGEWGGSAATRPDVLERARLFGRDLFFDGFAPSGMALVAIGLVLVSTLVFQRVTRRPITRRFKAAPLFVILAPYALWVFLAQNVAEQPRHLLPLVEGGLLGLACFLAPSRAAVAALCLLAASVSLPLLVERQQVPPAAAQAAEWVARNHRAPDTVVMAGRSWRYFAELPGPYAVRRHTWLSEVVVDLTHFDRLPPDIVLTSEVDLHSGMGNSSPLPQHWNVDAGPRFCTDPRIDRSDTCLGVSTLVWSPR